jgi:hypothetical protein
MRREVFASGVEISRLIDNRGPDPGVAGAVENGP